jgi:hypothetical protein
MPLKEPMAAATQVTLEPIMYIVPDVKGVIRRPGLLKDLAFPSMSKFIQEGRYERLLYQEKTESSFVVHRRSDNGRAGSGIKYLVSYLVNESASGYTVRLIAKEYETYQDGLVLKIPVPKYGTKELRDTLLAANLHYRFEIDSPYKPEAVYSNFIRLTKRESFRSGEKDPVTGKIFKDRFVLNNRNREVPFVVETYPYRDGSKVVAYIVIPAVETSANTVDFSVIIREIELQLTNIVRS